jgi:putative DNA primase/helicase
LKGAKFRKVLQLAITEGLIDKASMEETTINPVLIAKDLLIEHTFIVDDESDTLYFFDKELGIYSKKAKRLIRRSIAKYLDENSRASYYVDVEDFIRNTASLVDVNTAPELIAVENGLLNVLTQELKLFTPEQYITVKLPVRFDPEAKCPATEKFLREVLGEKDRKLTQEFAGYCLYRKILWAKALMLVGVGANGKSVFIDLNTALLGKENVVHQTIQNLCSNRFATAELHDKLANFSADLPSDVLQNTGRFKELVAGDRQSGERKYQDPFYFVPYAKYMWSCNTIPSIKSTEDNDAYYRRWILIKFTKQFFGKKDDKMLRDKLTTPAELSGYLNYALEGLNRLMAQQDFSENMTLEQTRQAYIKQSDSVNAFISEKIKATDEYTDFVFHDVLYRAYITYCHKEKLKTQSKAALTKGMQEHCSGAEHTKIRVEKGDRAPVPAWRYIKLRDQSLLKGTPKDPKQPELEDYGDG